MRIITNIILNCSINGRKNDNWMQKEEEIQKYEKDNNYEGNQIL